MAAIGLNIRADGYHDPVIVRELNATWIRVVAHPDHDLREYLARCRDASLRVLLTLARESFTGFGPTRRRDGYPLGDTARTAVEHYWTLYGDLISAIQVGNEPDLVSPSSWAMTPADLAALGHVVRSIFPEPFTVVTAGLASGQPSWLAGVDLSWASTIAFQPYAKDAPNPYDLEDLPDITDLLEGYRVYGLPLWITEWGWWTEDEDRGAEEVHDVIRWAATTSDLEVFIHFCLSDDMVPPFGILYDDLGEKPAAQEFREQAARALPPEPQPEPEVPEPRFVYGFAEWAEHDPELIGRPYEDEAGPLPGVSAQRTTNGFLLWISGVGMVFKDTRTGLWHHQPPEIA